MWCCAAPSAEQPELVIGQKDIVPVGHLKGSKVGDAQPEGLAEQPEAPDYKLALVQIKVRNQKFGGSDKSSSGHRYDSIPFANGMIDANMACQLLHYVHEEHDAFFKTLKHFDGVIVRCNPGQIQADGGDQKKFDEAMRSLRKEHATQIWSTPDVMELMGAKDALVKMKDTSIGLTDTCAYYTVEDFTEGFKKTMAFQPRVVKQNRGSSGEGIWIVKLKSGDYCKDYGEKSCEDGDILSLTEANDNHEEEHTVAEFIEFCCNGKTPNAGNWTSKGEGKYLEGGKEKGGQLVDQRFCPRIVEGELRYNMLAEECVGIIHKKPKEGGISAVGGTGSKFEHYPPNEGKFKHITQNFEKELPTLMAALKLPLEPLPLWWTSDFINSSPENTRASDEKWIVGEFNCSCVGISTCLEACCTDEKPRATYADISEKEKEQADTYGIKIGKKAKGIMEKRHPSSHPVDISSISRSTAKNYRGQKLQPIECKYKIALVQIYDRTEKFGGTDKSANGHRYDSMAFANGCIDAGMSCQLVHYLHDEHDKFFKLMLHFDALVVRCTPGQIKKDGGNQAKFDNALRDLRKKDVEVWPSPDVMQFMGAKDALVKIKDLTVGLEDTMAYYSAEEFAEGFKKTLAFQPRVIKQNRGSTGEGIWIVKLKSNNYCKKFGERTCEGSEVVELLEANDNHKEEHTVAQFIEFCTNGKTKAAGNDWTTKGQGKYLEGGKAKGGQLVDQRFCPRIVEGELRYCMINDDLHQIIHKKPKKGGISAVGGTGAVFTYHKKNDKTFMHLTKKFLQVDLAKIMPALGLEKEPLPLWWTADFILASEKGTSPKDEKWIAGEFNCSCVGIAKCLAAYCTPEHPRASYSDIKPEDLKDAEALGLIIGQKAMRILDIEAVNKPVPMHGVTRMCSDYYGVLAPPVRPKRKCAIIQIYATKYPNGGVYKSKNGHRYDTVPLANGVIAADMSCQMVHYVPEQHDIFFECCKGFDVLIIRCPPGQIRAAGGDQKKFDDAVLKLRKDGKTILSAPDVVEKLGGRDALTKLEKLTFGEKVWDDKKWHETGAAGTRVYYDEKSFAEGVKKTLATEQRVLKQNRGVAGGGVWVCKQKEANGYGIKGRLCRDDEVIVMTEMNDNHVEEHTIAELIEFFTKGRTEKSGHWSTSGMGKFLAGGKEAGGMILDQKFYPRVHEGELRITLVGDSVWSAEHAIKVGPNAPNAPGWEPISLTEGRYQPAIERFKTDLNKIAPAVGLKESDAPLLWNVELVNSSEKGCDVGKEKWVAIDINCYCVGMNECTNAICTAENPDATWMKLSDEDKEKSKKIGDAIGQRVLSIATKWF